MRSLIILKENTLSSKTIFQTTSGNESVISKNKRKPYSASLSKQQMKSLLTNTYGKMNKTSKTTFQPKELVQRAHSTLINIVSGFMPNLRTQTLVLQSSCKTEMRKSQISRIRYQSSKPKLESTLILLLWGQWPTPIRLDKGKFVKPAQRNRTRRQPWRIFAETAPKPITGSGVKVIIFICSIFRIRWNRSAA
jgi:hypothetical protein